MNVYHSLKWFLSISGFGLKTSVPPQWPDKWSQQKEADARSGLFTILIIYFIITTLHWVYEKTPFQRGSFLTALKTHLSTSIGQTETTKRDFSITSFLLMWALKQRQDKKKHYAAVSSWFPFVLIIWCAQVVGPLQSWLCHPLIALIQPEWRSSCWPPWWCGSVSRL